MDQNNLLVFKDLQHDAIAATPRGPETLEFTNQRYAGTARILSDRAEDGFQSSVPYFLRALVEMTKTLSRDLDLVHPAASDVILEPHTLALLSVPARPSKRLHQIVVHEDVQGFFKGLEIVGTQQDERGSPIASDQDAVVLPLNPVGDLREDNVRPNAQHRIGYLVNRIVHLGRLRSPLPFARHG